MIPTAPIPASLATACAAHDRHRLDVLDALLDEAAPSAVRELLAAALDLCASLRTRRDETEADLAACQTRIAGLEQAADERSAEVARLTARVAELEARPVLTVEAAVAAAKSAGWSSSACRDAETVVGAILASLGPVTLPAQDRAEELANVYVDEWNGRSDCRGDAQAIAKRTAAMHRALASLGAPPTSPPAARPVFAGVIVQELADVIDETFYKHSDLSLTERLRRSAENILARLEVSLVAPEFLRRIPLYTKHGPNGKGDPGPCDATCVKCEAERIVATLTAAGIPVTPEVGK